MHYAEILLPQRIGFDKETLTYSFNADQNIKLGQIVEVSIKNKKARGIVYNIHENPPSFATKEINKIVENAPHLKEWQLELIKFISEYYICPLYKVIKLFLPVNILKKKKLTYTADELVENIEDFTKYDLSEDQEKSLLKYHESTKMVSLLHGVTGSGKTEVYLRLAEEQMALGNQVLMLVPEISLTPQTLQRFNNRFPGKSAVIHSKLTAKEKEKEWQKISKGESQIAIGSRSAIFAPFTKLGLIIIDEEHEPSFKQDQSPRYNTIDIAKKICEILKIRLLVGSATPSIESYHKAINGEYELLEMPKRIQFNKLTELPKADIVDLREELKKKNYSVFSENLRDKIVANYQKQQQTILFINRRGAASSVLCRECGFICRCPHCEIAMTYHKKISIEHSIYNAERLICHHCGLVQKAPSSCPRCGSHYIRYIGLGTQKVEEELIKLLPQARIIRADADTVQRKDDFSKIYHLFKDHQADVLIGTQMIGKGLHIPKVSLVGVMLADLSLTIPDFRSAERTFQLITQVAGRAGREKINGEVIIQSYLPDNYAIKYASNHDYKGFYDYEIKIRQQLHYPPFTRAAKITITESTEQKAEFRANIILEHLKSLNLAENYKITCYPALISKLNNKFRWQVLIMGETPSQLIKAIQLPSTCSIDIDPISIN